MLDVDRRFWRKYLIGCTVLFALIFSGLYWDMNHIGFDPLTGKNLPETTSFDYYRDQSGFHMNYGNRVVDINTTLLPEVPLLTCWQLDFIVDPIQKSITIQNNQVDPYYCGLAPALPHVT